MNSRLTHQSSPFLQSHATDPIEWFPWGNEALSKAKKYQKPLFVSLGYLSCHWCQAMGAQSFNNLEVAQLLNQDFICILIDKDERPDLAKHFLKAAQVSSGHSGWPLNLFCTPEGSAYYGVTYLPKDSSKGMPGLLSIIPQAARVWKEKQDSVLKDALLVHKEVFKEIGIHKNHLNKVNYSEPSLQNAFYEDLKSRYDYIHGGFDKSPKFPNPSLLMSLARTNHVIPSNEASNMIQQTLRSMHSRGYYDHVGGGFYRYCMDQKWEYPHFEKIGFDNAWMAYLYIDCYKHYKHAQSVAFETLEFLVKDLQQDNGLFAYGINADTEGREGSFYLWRAEEVFNVLGTLDGIWFCELMGFTPEGNFPNTDGKLDGLHHLNQLNVQNLDNKEDRDLYDKCLRKLREKRSHRDKPIIEVKYTVESNAMIAISLIQYANTFEKSEWTQLGLNLIDQIRKHRQQNPSRMIESQYFGSVTDYLDDGVYYSWALYSAYKLTGDEIYSTDLTLEINRIIEKFWDDKLGGFFYNDYSQQYPQQKEFHDTTYPSANAILYQLLKKFNADKYAEQIVKLQQIVRELDPENLSYFSLFHFNL